MRKFFKKYEEKIDMITGFLFIALVFYLFYFSLWIFY